jgi:hypothetical protein
MATSIRSRSLFAVSVLVVALVAVSPTPARAAWTSRADAATLLDLVNRERAAEGLASLASRDDIVAVATPHNEEMAANSELYHNPDYFSPENRAHLKAKAMGENVAVNSKLKEAHRRLMASPGHRANILDPRFDSVGFAVTWATKTQVWVTEDFVQSAGGSGPSRAASTPESKRVNPPPTTVPPPTVPPTTVAPTTTPPTTVPTTTPTTTVAPTTVAPSPPASAASTAVAGEATGSSGSTPEWARSSGSDRSPGCGSRYQPGSGALCRRPGRVPGPCPSEGTHGARSNRTRPNVTIGPVPTGRAGVTVWLGDAVRRPR